MAPRTQISFIGVGNMGEALVKAHLKAGTQATIWNRTPSRKGIAELVDQGAKLSVDLADAIAASPLVIICLVSYAAIRTALDSNPAAVEALGKADAVVNLTTGSPKDARDFGAWLSEHDVKAYIDGGIMTTPALIGTPASFILCSGEDEAAFKRHQPQIDVLGRTQYMGSDVGAAALYDLSLLAGMYSMFSGTLTAIALARRAKPEDGRAVATTRAFVANMLNPMLQALLPSNEGIALGVDNDDLGAHGHPMDMMVEGVRQIVRASEEEKVDASVLKVFLRQMEAVTSRNGGELGLASVVAELEASR